MKIELHILQNFAPSNLNRDDTGAPKDCELGGYRRARISSQCQKRAVREAFRLDHLVPTDNLASRTKRIVYAVATTLKETHQRDEMRARAVALGAIEGVGLGRNKKAVGDEYWKTEYLLFVPRRIVGELAALLHKHWDQLEPLAGSTTPDEASKEASPEATPAEETPAAEDKNVKGAKAKGAKKETKKDLKKEAKAAYPKEIQQAVEKLLESARSTADLALFGRMIADKTGWNVEASCQVAQAISTHKVQMDFDFFTAVDDFKPGETAGSDMMGTVQFNSSCFYRYAVLDVDALRQNLDLKESDPLLATSLDAFVRAFLIAIPTGKQNSMAAHNFPSYALAVVREKGTSISLTNAFLKPARPQGDEIDLVDDSITKLEDYFARMRDALGEATAISWADREVDEIQRRGSEKKADRSGQKIERAAALSQFYAQVKARALKPAGAKA
jgi:CRISPR system Cascade subunit CasC